MVSKKIIFLGSKPIGYQCLAYLISQKKQLNLEITGLLTKTRKEFGGVNDLNSLALAHDIPVISSLDELPECDILYSVQYHQILKEAHIKKAKQVAVNLHMAPLPEYRGSNQFSFAIIDQKKEFGTTVHVMDHKIDHGDILFQERFPIPENCWVNDLYELTYHASVNLFRQTLANIIEGNYIPEPQEQFSTNTGAGIHFRKEIKDIKILDLSWEKEKLERYIRATSMPGFEPPYFFIDEKKVHISAGM